MAERNVLTQKKNPRVCGSLLTIKMLGGLFCIQYKDNYFFLVVFVPLPFLDPLGWGDPQGIDLTSYG
jgi:hypothetical protein